MKRTSFLILMLLALAACKKDPPPETGDLLVITRYDSFLEPEVNCWLYDSYYNFEEEIDIGFMISDPQGEVIFTDLLPGWYIVYAEKVKSSMLTIAAFDSVYVEANKQLNKTMHLY